MQEMTNKVDGWSKKWIKIFLCMTCTVLCYLAVLLMTISTVSKLQYEQLDVFMDTRMYRMVLFLVLVASIAFVLAFVGFLGTWKENHPALYTFCSLLVVFSLMESTVAFIGYKQRQNIESDMESNLWLAVNNYPLDITWQPYVDVLQMQLQCCGVNSYSDWLRALPPDELAPEDAASMLQSVPLSCYDPTDITRRKIFDSGCHSKLYDIFYETGKTVLLNTLCAITLQLFAAFFAFFLLGKLKRLPECKEKKAISEQNAFGYSKMQNAYGGSSGSV
ncbi:leukocyte surface antigen CD53-like [Anopheles cruzii]|uniref:leukocyte surface antigen CD53-like n=1 Tax=Anopheles cruzii TaxID=68878 RepID=UPI0022EC3E26|nr:leukocyte surface antigen CD53-like [Anopheles cruzii]